MCIYEGGNLDPFRYKDHISRHEDYYLPKSDICCKVNLDVSGGRQLVITTSYGVASDDKIGNSLFLLLKYGRPSYVYNVNPYTGKMESLYRYSPRVSCIISHKYDWTERCVVMLYGRTITKMWLQRDCWGWSPTRSKTVVILYFVMCVCHRLFTNAGLILCMGSANGRRRYTVTSSPNGWVHTQNDPSVTSSPIGRVHTQNDPW